MSTGVIAPPMQESAAGVALTSSGLSSGLSAGPALDAKSALAIRRKAALEGCKWDAQVGDALTLAPFPLVMKRPVWNQLARWAEQLATEAESAEQEILGRPDLLRLLGLPRRLWKLLGQEAPLAPAAGRVIRFDFHFTTGGWRISEANSDVPGGFSEASHFTSMLSEYFPGWPPTGSPGDTWSDALAAAAGPGGAVALLSAPGFLEDHQVVSYLAARLRERGCRTWLAKPEQLRWHGGSARLETTGHRGPLDAIVRFYQAEWMARLPATVGWEYLFRRGKTPVANPALAVISESKRFPVVWDQLLTPLSTWRALLPATRDPRDTAWRNDDAWLVKTAMCNTGDTVSIRELMPSSQWKKTILRVALSPGRWVAQERFRPVAVSTPIGPRYACVGVYTVNGRAAGAYARLAEKPVTDFTAVDVALLINEDD